MYKTNRWCEFIKKTEHFKVCLHETGVGERNAAENQEKKSQHQS
jgi:hypothetical protein